MMATKKVTSYSFFQLLRRLSLLKSVYLETSTVLAFPAAISQEPQNNQGVVNVALNGFGLLGVDSPLPLHFHHYHSLAWRSFINVLNNHFYWLLFDVWKQQRPIIAAQDGCHPHFECLTIFSGYNKLQYVDLFCTRYRMTYGLKQILYRTLNPASVEVKEFVYQWQKIKEKAALNNENRLGKIILGDYILQAHELITIYVKFNNFQKASLLINQPQKKKDLFETIKRYLGPMIQFQFIIKFILFQARPLSLINQAVQLNGLSLLGKGRIENSFILV